MKIALYFIFSFLFLSGKTQDNLILNPGFEAPEEAAKYQNIGIFNLDEKVEMTPTHGIPSGYVLSKGWSMPTLGTSDYLIGKSCSAFGWPMMQPKSGNGRGGFALGGKNNDNKEYLQATLVSPLEKNKKYCLKFYIAHEKVSNYSISEISAYFSHEKLNSNSKKTLPLDPHITLSKNTPITHHQGWVEVCGTYVATGGEKYITIGNFGNDEAIHVKGIYEDYKENGGKQGFMHPFKNKAYYYIDDVSLEKKSDSTFLCEEWKLKDSAENKNWVFLIDASGSMSTIDKLPSIKMELQQISSIVPAGSNISMVVFGNTNASIITDADLSDTDLITKTMNRIGANGGSSIPYSFSLTIGTAKRMALNGLQTEIFIFTDGAISGKKEVLNTIKQDNLKDLNIKVNTIQFGKSIGNKKTLEEIAEAGNGDYYNTQQFPLRRIFRNNIGVEFIKKLNCESFSDCCKPQIFIDQYSYNNTTFLLDVSGSMKQKSKLPRLQQTLIDLSDSMRIEDRLSIVQFSGTAKMILEPTSYQNKEEIQQIITHLQSNGNTNLDKGIKEAVDKAIINYKSNSNNSILIATDGKAEFTKSIKRSIKEAKKHDIHTSILHFSKYEGEKLQKIAKLGEGTYHQIDETNLWDEFTIEIKKKKMGPEFYQYDKTYSTKKKDQINSYRWSRVIYAVSPFFTALYKIYSN